MTQQYVAMPADVFQAAVKVISTLPYGQVDGLMEQLKQCKAAHLDQEDAPKPGEN